MIFSRNSSGLEKTQETIKKKTQENIQKLKQNEHQVLSCIQKKCKINTPVLMPFWNKTHFCFKIGTSETAFSFCQEIFAMNHQFTSNRFFNLMALLWSDGPWQQAMTLQGGSGFALSSGLVKNMSFFFSFYNPLCNGRQRGTILHLDVHSSAN